MAERRLARPMLGDRRQMRLAFPGRRRTGSGLAEGRRRRVWLVGALAFALAMVPAVANSEPLTVEAVNEGIYGHHWAHAQQTVLAGESVTFANSSEVPHGVEWRSAVKPVCEEGAGKVPVGTTATASGTKWSGKCKFTQPGTYTFWCTVHGAEMSGTITVTNPGEPTASAETAASVTESEATLRGVVNPQGKPAEYFFKYGTTTSYGSTTSVQSAGEGTASVPVSAVVSGLLPGTTYHFRLFATNEKGKAESGDQTFTTVSPPGPPSATTSDATAGETTATLRGSVNPDGKPTSSFFQWGTGESYGQSTAEVPAGEDHTAHSASAALTELAPGTVYHYRVVAKNETEVVYGADRTFTTTSPPPPPKEEPKPSPSPTPSPAPNPSPGPISPEPEIAPLVPPLVSPLVPGSLKLSASHRGQVRGSIDVSQTGAGGRLEVDLIAKSATPARSKHGAKQVSVGRLVRASVPAGRVSFSVGLNAHGKSLLLRHRKLALSVKVTLTPRGGTVTRIARSLVLRS